MILDNYSIKTRLAATLFLTVATIIILGVFSLSQMNILAELTESIYEHPLEVTNASLRANLGVVKMNTTLDDLLSIGGKFRESESYAILREEEKKVYENLDIVKERILGDEGGAIEKEARELFAAWKPIREETLRLIAAGDRQTAALWRENTAKPHIRRTEQKMQELYAYSRNKAIGFKADAERVELDARSTSIVIVLTAAAFSALLLYLILRSIVFSVTSLKGTMSEITKTGKLSRSGVEGKNEIAEMARHFNGLIDALENQFWLRDGQNSLNRELLESESYEKLLDKSVTSVSRYIDACSGALYILAGNEGRCFLRSSYALATGEHVAISFKPGEGIVGQVALERKPILLANIRRGEAVVRSGTISEPPRSIYAIPLVYEDSLLGVLEVASFEEIDEIRRAFLDAAGVIIATSIYTAAQAKRIQELLAEAQASNESLLRKTDELNAANQEMSAANNELQAQSHELRSQTAELEEQQARLQEADRLKSEFLSNMSHELRTPLNSVLALSQLMISRGAGKNPAQEQEYLRVIERNGRHLLALLNDILDLSKIESGKLELVAERFEPRAVAERVVETVEPLARAKGLKLTLGGDAPAMISDMERVRQILTNLMGNAVKFTERGEVEVRLSQKDGFVLFSVRDTGIGIEARDMAFIFDEFRQVDGSTTRRHEGTGLGLAICQKLARLLGGHIAVESQPGEGSTFVLYLPLGEPPSGEAEKPVQAVAKSSGPSADVKTVLVIDDEESERRSLKSYLESAGYRVVTASSGRKAIEAARREKPSAISLDVIMPDMDGWEVISRLKASPETAAIPVMVVSVSDDRDTGEALGVSGYALKPVDKAYYVSEISRLAGESAKPPAGRKGPKESRGLIFAVEDNSIATLQIRSALEEAGFGVETASGGAEALRKIAVITPDAIILDLMMPDVDGFEVLEQLRSTERTARLPVLVLTAKELTAADRSKLSHNNVQELIQKGSIDREELVAKVSRLLGYETAKQAPAPAEVSAGPAPLPRPARAGTGEVILLVEDNPDNRFTMSAILEELGHRYEIAEDGAQALEAAARLRPALILMDVQLPVLSGIDATRRLKEDPSLSDIPVVALTAKAMKGDREALLAAGFDDYIPKPVDTVELASVIRKWMR
ncbi:response regulator [bacterium]|nr:MAG: response regulator [bacterium]